MTNLTKYKKDEINLDGIIVINKQKNYTSHDIVYKIKKIVNEKVGHTGTLDPLATGVLPILIGKGTLCSKYLINHNKTYQVELKLGKKTETADREGKILEEKEVPLEILEENKVNKTLQEFIGKQTQIPPIYSAIKVNGKKLYEYARKNQDVEIKPRNIEIYRINLLEIDKQEKIIKFEVSCSKGTYIRTLCEDIAERLETVGYMYNLNRIQVGEFNISNAIGIEEIQKSENPKKTIEKNLITIEELFNSKESIQLNDKKLSLFLNGVKLTQEKQDGIYKIYNDTKFIGIGVINNKLLKRDIVI